MAIPPQVMAAVAAGGASIGGTIISSINARNENRWARDYNERMYNQSLSDERVNWMMQNEYNEAMWHKMNEYNSPMSQMNRFKEAGLNPNLIYGQGNTTPAIATAKPGRGQQGNAVAANLPPIDLAAGIEAYYRFNESSARTNNMEQHANVLAQEAIGKSIDNINKGIKNESDSINLDILKRYSADAARLSLEKQQQDLNIGWQRNEREAALNSSNLREAAERIMNLRGDTYNKALDYELKQLDYDLKKYGIQPGDNFFMRILGRFLNSSYSDDFLKGYRLK